MANETMYRQCRLQKKIEGGVRETMSYIPSKFAVVGRVLKLRNPEKEWDDGWRVVSASSTEHSEKETSEGTQLHKRQRRASDI